MKSHFQPLLGCKNEYRRRRNERFKDRDVYTVQSLETSKNTFSVEEHVYREANLGVTVGFYISSSINGTDEMLVYESL